MSSQEEDSLENFKKLFKDKPDILTALGNLDSKNSECFKSEPVSHYYHIISLIAGRLSRYNINQKLNNGQSLFSFAAFAICAYGLKFFHNTAAMADMKNQFNMVIERLTEVEKLQQKDITEEYVEIRTVPKMEKVVVQYGDGKKELQTVVGYEEEVVVAHVMVGTEYLKGGYPAIEFFIGLGLGVQHFCNDNSPDLSISMSHGNLLVEQKLLKLKAKIEQLVDEASGEPELIKLLEKALVN
jgi:translation elongation factor EF-1beta